MLLGWAVSQDAAEPLTRFISPYLADRTWPMEILHGVTAKLRFHGDVALLVAAELHQAAGDLDTAIWTVAHAQPTAHAALPPSSSTPTNPVCQNRIHRLPDSPVHGGPYPATSAPSTTSVGSLAIERFLRPVAYQNVPETLLAPEIRTGNPLQIWRRIDGTPGHS